ncbi:MULTISPECIES: metal ABC transporter substrate-binding protein [Atopobiaceae]|uniref:Zinc transport system substrate-binding protein n=1 Tax=Parafannyhessea umbonata TaxID=604330 RepID=A0A1H6K426_9ACTN|nr:MULTISPECIES: metal ABC transporter substrate-binding protein [Atopobiaceae]SEH69638.1 zinc transport system substrate-binding protein [Parafannyhessea umbonata]SJZ82641.1 zinc transport system substrate-binding protein [Olsenella sp. KH1P3]
MKKSIIAAAASALLALACVAGCASGTASNNQSGSDQGQETKTVKVVASFYPMADYAKKIGGDRVEVVNLVPAGTEPHDWEPSTDDMKTLESADVFVYNGAGMEKWVDQVSDTLSNDRLVKVEASQGIQLRAGADEEQGQYDPHVWLSPQNAKVEMANIRDALIAADPGGKDVYEKNYETYAAKLDELDQQYQQRLSAVPNKNIVVSHQAFGYLCDAYGLNQVAIEGLDAESEPDAKTMAEIVDFAKDNHVKVIFGEDLVSPKVAQQIADESGAQCKVLNPLEGLTDEQLAAGEDYFSVMEKNLDELVEALS